MGTAYGGRERGAALRRVGALFGAGTAAGLTDAELLGRFAARGASGEGAEAAFAALVERHGPTVLRLCRRVLDDPTDAEDAFQATFLVLVRRAGAIRRRESVGSWLQGVALRVASASRASASRRRRHERRKAEMATAAGRGSPAGSEVAPLVHEELGRLPERFRAAVVLCDLEGLTYDEAAGRLGWPVGTVKSRLSRGRARLRARLSRRGLAPGVGLFPAPAAWRPVPPTLLDATVRAASAFAAGQSATEAAGTAAVASLTTGILKMMFMTRLKSTAALAAVGLFALGTGVAAPPSAGGRVPAATDSSYGQVRLGEPADVGAPAPAEAALEFEPQPEPAQTGEARPPAYEQILVVPLRVHVLKSDRVALADARINDARVREALANANAIWAKAGLFFDVESVTREPAAQPQRFQLVSDLNNGNVSEAALMMLLPKASRAVSGLNLYVFHELPFNGATLADDAGVVVEEVGLQEVAGGAGDHLARVIARTLATTIGLPGHSDGANLLGSGTNGAAINATQAANVRKLGRTLAGAATAGEIRTAARAAEAKKDVRTAHKLWSTLAELPGSGSAEARTRRDALKGAASGTP